MAEMIKPNNQFNASQLLVLQQITNGSYFVYNEVPTGSINGVNVTFTLASSPNPVTNLKLKLNGQVLRAGGNDYTLSGSTITMVNAPFSGDVLLATYTVSPV